MTTMTHRAALLPALLALLAALAALAGGGGCGRGPAAAADAHAGAHAEASADPHAAGGDDATGGAAAAAHDHEDEPEASDLDRPLDELFAASCEHGTRTYACDECRYEVGVARAPAALLQGGLLAVGKPAREAARVPLALTGEVRFDERRVAHLAPAAPGVVARVRAAIGDRVRKGDVLVEIRSGEAGAAAAELREARSLLSLAAGRFERQRQLREQGIAAEKDYRQAEQEHEAARIRLETAAAQAARLGVGLGAGATAGAGAGATAPGGEAARDGDDILRLRAPADGTVVFLHAVGGELVRPEETVAIVGDVATVQVVADLYERDLPQLYAARAASPSPLAAEVAVRAWPGRAFTGAVDLVGPALDEGSRTAKLRVTVPNPDGRLLAGMFATVRVLLPGDRQALVLPREAVLEDEGRAFVFVHHHDDFYVRRPVTRGLAWDDRVEVTDGLAGDETVVTAGAFLLKSDVLRAKMGAGCAD